ncbi:MAG: TonB-dependent receptor [Oleispira sp.]|nr:TonB-dependent receptor [Oleispira sp.]MBL4880112.1 TonB-dependent receptor [Oleispira sp.]
MKTLPLSLAITSALTAMLVSASVHSTDIDGTDVVSSEQTTDSVELDAVTVSADFRSSELQTIPASISVISEDVIEQRSARHIEEILAVIPNVNYAAGASRGRYFQIRGIGERSQFVAPLNPSVGTFVDGVDFTGFGGAATLIDVEQVEVLRGSQGTRFGANALAGVINVKAVEPSLESKGYVKFHAESYNGYGLEAAHGGAISENVLYRAAIGKTVSDGYIENTTLDKQDTNNIDELTSRLKLRWLASEDLTVDLSALYLDIDNGYDAFSLDENRKTRSDEPGHDRQETLALALDANWKISDAVTMEGILTSNRTDAEYGFDEDWTDPAFQPGYQAFDNYERDLKRDSVELRWLSGPAGKIMNSDWLVGVYYQDSSIDLTRDYTYDPLFTSEYKTASASVFSELNTSLTDNLILTSGIRLENWQSDYSDNNSIAGDNSENLVGGKLALEYTTNSADLVYASITRGYKAGGFNGEANLPSEDLRDFDTEYQWNYEIGSKFSALQASMNHRISLFYTDRQDLQLKSSTAVDNGNGGVSFVDYTSNAGKGFSYGAEWEMDWQVVADLSLSTSLGLLKTEITEHNNPDPDAFNLEGREAAHAPAYTYATAVNYALTNYVAVQVQLEGKDEFFYSDSHDYKSESYNLINARLTYQRDNFEVALYGKNLTDEEYGVRGFAGWDADPRSGDGFDETEYQQLAAPRVVGVSTRVNF